MRVPLLQEILDLYPTLPPAERLVADLILGQPQDVVGMTSEDIARRVSVSQPTTSRFCARLSPGAFPSFKVQLAQQLGAQASQQVLHLVVVSDLDGTGPGTMLGDALEQTRTTLEHALNAVSTLSPVALEKSSAMILDANSIVTCGFDLSGSVAWRLASLLHLSGLHARSERDPYSGSYWMDLLAEGDLVIVVSYRGNVPQILDAIGRARSRGVLVMVITNEAQSALVPLADHVLLSHAPAARSNEDYTTGDALYVQLAVIRALWFATRQMARTKAAQEDTN